MTTIHYRDPERVGELEAALRERILERCEDGPALATFRLDHRWIQSLDAVSGDTTLGGLLARESSTGADLDPVYRARYLGLACGLVRTKVTPSEMPFRESFSA